MVAAVISTIVKTIKFYIYSMKPKLFTTIVIIILAALLTVLTSVLLTIAFWGNAAYDINLHDTYIVMPEWLSGSSIIIDGFIFLLFVFAGRCIVGKFKLRRENVILLVLLFLAQVIANHVANLSAQIQHIHSSLSIYPPLSALPNVQAHEPDHHIAIFSCLPIILLVLLVIVAIITGKNWRRPPYENAS
jgi:hypothetical protein